MLALFVTRERTPPPPPPEVPVTDQRILSLSPNITETLFALGLGPQVVGVTEFCRYPAEALQKETIGGLLNPNIEKMFALEPTMAIMLPAQEDLARKLEAHGIRTVVIGNDRMADILESILAIGRATRTFDRAAQLTGSIRDIVAKTQIDKPKRRWKVMMVVERQPRMLTDLYVVGPGTYLDEILTMIGCENVYGNALAKYPTTTVEEVLHRQPDVIIELGPSRANREEATAEARKTWAAIPNLEAVRNGRVFVMTGDHLLVPGPRIGRTIAEMAALVKGLGE